jgi:GAF domain-containing protein
VRQGDPEKVALGRAIHDRWPPDPADETGVYGVLRSGAPLVLPQLTAEAFDVLEDEERRRALQDLGMRSVVVVAMRGRARTIGLLTLVHAESGRAFGEADVAFAQELADRAGVAVENARLIDRAGPPADGAS